MSVFTQATASRSARRMMTDLALVGVSALLLTGCSTSEPAAPTASDAPMASADGVQPVTAGDRDLTIKPSIEGTVNDPESAAADLFLDLVALTHACQKFEV